MIAIALSCNPKLLIAVESYSRTMHLPRVVFPEPLSPTSPTVSPFFIVNSTSLTLLLYPTILFKKPLRISKYFFNPLTSNIFSVEVAIFPPYYISSN